MHQLKKGCLRIQSKPSPRAHLQSAMVWIPSIGDRVVCDGRRPLGRGPTVNDLGPVGVIVQIAPSESQLEYYVDPQDGIHAMLTNTTRIKI